MRGPIVFIAVLVALSLPRSLKVGIRYFVHASRVKDGSLFVIACGSTAPAGVLHICSCG